MTAKSYYRSEDFAAHASPEAIEAYLHREREAAKRVARRIAWLEDLHIRRTAERDSGAWPTTPGAAE